MIEIRRKVLSEGTGRYYKGTIIEVCKKYRLYVVVADGRRIDSFIRYRNASRKVREWKKCNSPRRAR